MAPMISFPTHKKSSGPWQFARTQILAPGLIVLILFCTLPPAALQARETASLHQYVQNGGYALSKKGIIIASENLQTPFIPASTIKLITCLAALEILGPDYRFSTYLYLDQHQNLYIRGSGDPFLVSEAVAAIAERVAEHGITMIHDIILDDSSFAVETPTDGSGTSKNPYDAQPSALAVNFNTLPLHSLRKAKVRSFEAHTPYLPLMGKIGKNIQSGRSRININSFPDVAHISNTLTYSGELFQATLSQHGIRIQGTIKQGNVPNGTPLILHHMAKETMSDLVRSCLRSSSNFMANQLFLTIGISRYGTPATWEKGQRALNDFIENNLQLQAEQVTMVEGSGLSKKNRITPEGMLLVLEKFKPYAALLSIKYGVRMKSGTLNKSKVYCYAGYFEKGKDLNPFVILLNQQTNSRDHILQALYGM